MSHRRVVVGLTTIPSRVRHLDLVLRNLLKQTRMPDALCVSIPEFSTKEMVRYPVEEMQRTFAAMDRRIRVVIVPEDYGPLTKLMGMLLSENDPGCLLITVDDDQLYGPTFVETLVRGSEEHAGAAVCLCGHILGRGPSLWGFRCSRNDGNPLVDALFIDPGSRVTVVSGWCGCAYPRSAFPVVPDPRLEKLRKGPGRLPLLNRHDDLYVSCWLYLNGVPKVVVAYKGPHYDVELDYAKQGALSSSDGTRSIETRIMHLKEWWTFARQLQKKGLLESQKEEQRLPWHKSTVVVAVGGATLVVLLLSFLVYQSLSRRRSTH
jgi:hypothetical protein